MSSCLSWSSSGQGEASPGQLCHGSGSRFNKLTKPGDGHPRPADPVLGAGRGAVAHHRALMVPSALYLAQDGRLLVAFRPPDYHHWPILGR